jgi:hypothetical protein
MPLFCDWGRRTKAMFSHTLIHHTVAKTPGCNLDAADQTLPVTEYSEIDN